MGDKKFSKVDLYGVGNMMIALLEQGVLTLDDCDLVMRRIAADSGLSDLNISMLMYRIHEKVSKNREEEKLVD